jgi:DNA-binding NarL/FixJ family response regulator
MADIIWERDAALASAERSFDRARRGEGNALFVVGEPGVGKTTVLQRARALAGPGLQVGVGRGDASEATLPFGILDQAVRALGGSAALDQDSPPLSGLDARAATFYAILRFIESGGPRILLLDDLHWADEDSLALVSFLCRRIRTLPVGIIGSLRPWPSAALETADRLAQAGDATLERLEPLSESAVVALLRDRLGRSVSPSSARRVDRFCAGNPLLLEQLAIKIRAGRVVARAGIPSRRPVTDGEGLLMRRFAGTGAAALAYAQAASLFGSRFRPALVRELAGLSEPEGGGALDVLTRARLVRMVARDLAEFIHPLFSQVLYEDLPSAKRTRWHGSAFRILIRLGADDAEASEHALRGGLLGDSEAIATLRRAGISALGAGAVTQARLRLQAAVDLAGQHASIDLLLELGDSLVAAGSGNAARDLYRRVLNTPAAPASARITALRRMGMVLYSQADVKGAEAALEEAVEASSGEDVALTVEALLDLALIEYIVGGPANTTVTLARIRTLLDGVTPALRIRAQTLGALCALMQGDPNGIPVIEQAERGLEADPRAVHNDLTHGGGWGTIGSYLNVMKWTEQFGEATRVFSLAWSAVHARAVPVAVASLAVSQADTFIRMGHLAEALRLAEHACSLAELAGPVAPFAMMARAWTLLELGREAESETWIAKCEALPLQSLGPPTVLYVSYVRGRLDLHAGRVADACRVFERMEAVAEQSGIIEPCMVLWHHEAFTAYLASDRLHDARRVAARLASLAASLPCRYPRVVQALCQAALAEKSRDAVQAQKFLVDAVALSSGGQMPLVQARALLAYGAFLRRRGEVREARPMLASALELAERSAAMGLRARAAEELGAARGRRHRRVAHPDHLTAQEARVATRAAEGLTNRQIARELWLTEDTIESHLQRVYGKLGIGSRKELIRSRLVQKL